jgi:dienelactone hydrolase
MSLSAMRALCVGAALAVFVFPVASFAAPPPIEAYGKQSTTETVRLSPDGSMIAIVARQNDDQYLGIAKVDGAAIAKIPIKHPFIELDWAGNDYVVVYQHYQGTRAMSVSTKDGSVRILPRAKTIESNAEEVKESLIRGGYGIAEQDGRWYAFYGLRMGQTRYPDLYRVDLSTGDYQHVAGGTLNERRWVVDPAGQIVAESEYEPNSGSWRVFKPGGSETPLLSGTSPYSFGFLGFGRSPTTVLLQVGGESGDITELNLSNGHVENFLPPGKSLEFVQSRISHLLLGVNLIDDGKSIIFDPVLDRHYQAIAKAFQGHRILVSSVSDDLSRMIVHVTGADTAGTWQFIDFKTGKSTPVAEDHADITDAMISPARMFDYAAKDGLSMQGVLTLPSGDARNLPLIVMAHGGPEERARIGFSWLVQAFASQGYAVFEPNYRGSSGYGMEFRNAGFGQWGKKMQTDMSDGIAALAAKQIIDPRRVCIVGLSHYGGYAAIAGITLQQNIYRCAVSHDGISDLHAYLEKEKGFDGWDTKHYAASGLRLMFAYTGAAAVDDASLDEISVRRAAGSADGPLLAIYGDRDSPFWNQQSQSMISALKSADKTVETLSIDDYEDDPPQSATRTKMLTTILGFVEKYNPATTRAAH